ncbi:hypothetical protein [Caldalkalibacillus salinus]|uniref:hypothetical protein n=1 Tax=Caldalkalibacillus salinus TaxID=2803787 RepID=UPI0019211EBC|nr:hypothetical protein [Caldalkalibacillus salinus]
MSYQFVFDERLGISLPVLEKPWEDYSLAEQSQMILEWESHRSDIPDRIKEIEKIIIGKQQMLSVEENFQRSCELNKDIAELASVINDLNIWFRIQQDTQRKMHA